MKIVDRATFLAMPAGVVFAKYSPCVFGDVLIKGDSIQLDQAEPFDFWYQQINDSLDVDDSYEFTEKLEAAKETGASVQMDFTVETRDGLFDADQLFAVWDSVDVNALIDRLTFALQQVRDA